MKYLVFVTLLILPAVFIAPADAGVLKNKLSVRAACTDDLCTQLCNQVFPNRGCTGKCISDTECQCTCNQMDVFFVKPEKKQVTMQKAACTDDLCTQLCNQVFPNRGCTGKCISDTECQCTCNQMDVFFVKPEKKQVTMQKAACTDDLCTQLCNQVFPNRGCTGKCISDTECQCTCNQMDVFFVKPEKKQVTMQKAACTDDLCTQLCNQVFPNRDCTGKCISDTECQCTCNQMDVFFVKPEKKQVTMQKAACTDDLCTQLCNQVFPNRGCTGKCISDTECQCTCNQMDVFFVKPEKKQVTMQKAACTDDLCTQLCNQVFPNRGCTGKCISDTECQCTCNQMDVFFVKPEKKQVTMQKAACTDDLCTQLCNQVFPNRGCTGKCISDTECQCTCNQMDVFFVKPEKKQVTMQKAACTDDLCTQLCNQVFPNRDCTGKCISDTECQCTCNQMDVFFVKP